MSTSPRSHWDRLASDQVAGDDDGFGIPTLPSGVQWSGKALRFAAGADGEARLLVPLDMERPPPSIPSMRNIGFTVLRIHAVGATGLYLDVTCLDQSLVAVFSDFCESVEAKVAAGEDPGASVARTVDEFKSLFECAGRKRLSDSERLGLVGELWMLQQLTSIKTSMLSAWSGPARQRHDFRRRHIAFEVKTTSRKGASRVTISSIEQLSRPEEGELYLWNPVFEPAMDGAFSIATLCASIQSKGVVQAEFERILDLAGVSLATVADDETETFALEGFSAYRVEPGFPRLSLEDFGGGFPAGVLALSYEVDLNIAAPWKLSHQEAMELMKGFCA